jgi:hypothetical protein
MADIEVIMLTWGGRETAATAIQALQRQAKVEITLPANIHHGLFRRLYPDAAVTAAEGVNVFGGAELIAPLAALAGLESLAELAEPLNHWGYRLQLRSPSPVLSLIPPQMT